MITLLTSLAGTSQWPPGVITALSLPDLIQLPTVLVSTPASAAACPVFIGSPFSSLNLAVCSTSSMSLAKSPGSLPSRAMARLAAGRCRLQLPA